MESCNLLKYLHLGGGDLPVCALRALLTCPGCCREGEGEEQQNTGGVMESLNFQKP